MTKGEFWYKMFENMLRNQVVVLILKTSILFDTAVGVPQIRSETIKNLSGLVSICGVVIEQGRSQGEVPALTTTQGLF